MPSAKIFSTDREAALFYLEKLRDDVAKSANHYFFEGKYVSYGDAREREAKLSFVLSEFKSCFNAYREPTDQELRDLESDRGTIAA